MALTLTQRSERAEACRDVARQIESCWECDSFGAAAAFIRGDRGGHLGRLVAPRWMRPLLDSGDPQATVRGLRRHADELEPS